MVLIGATPPGRVTEQHDVFFGIGTDLKDLLPDMQAFWPEAQGQIHLDAWREVRFANGYEIRVCKREECGPDPQEAALFFLNLGGYKRGDFEEYHYKMVVAAASKTKAIQLARQSAFYKHTGFRGASSHIDEQYGIDVDDMHRIDDILPARLRTEFGLQLVYTGTEQEDAFHIGYVAISKLVRNK